MAKKYQHYKVWLDGEIVAPEDANISVFTATAMRGANVYEGLRAYWNPNAENLYVWKLEEHLKRLFHSMRTMRIVSPYSFDEYRQGILDWARANEFREDVHLRLVTYLGDGGGGDVSKYKPDEIGIGAWISGGPRKHKDALEQGIEVCISSWRRINDDSIPARVKAGSNYQNSRLAGVEARVNGYDDALILTRDGKLAEAPGANVMLIRDGGLITPSVTSGILEGVTRAVLMELFHKHRNRPVSEREVDRTELYAADEIFVCGSAAELTPVVSVDRIPIGEGHVGPITRELQTRFFDAVRGRDPDHVDSLVAVY